MNQGITFTVYSDEKRNRKNFSFDIILEFLQKNEWTETGITQRLRALNLFLGDIYNEQLIVKGIIPAALITTCPHYLPSSWH
jgi:uncharacterized circularly permuted ATP-grasp superfamily protein